MFDWSTGRAANGATRERPDPEDQGAAEVEEISALNDYAASFLEAETDTKTLLSMLDDGPRPDFKASAVEDGLEAMACALTQLESSAYACEATDTRMAGLRDCKSRRKRLARLQRQWFLVTKENGCYIDERIRSRAQKRVEKLDQDMVAFRDSRGVLEESEFVGAKAMVLLESQRSQILKSQTNIQKELATELKTSDKVS